MGRKMKSGCWKRGGGEMREETDRERQREGRGGERADGRETDRQGQTDRQTERQRQPDRQTDRDREEKETERAFPDNDNFQVIFCCASH